VRDRAAPPRPLRPGARDAREVESSRPGPQPRSATRDVAPGRRVAPTVPATRPAADCAEPVRQPVARDPSGPWRFLPAHRNPSQSDTRVRFVAAACGRDDPVGVTGPSGRVEALKPRAACHQEPRPRSRLVYTPKYAMNTAIEPTFRTPST